MIGQATMMPMCHRLNIWYTAINWTLQNKTSTSPYIEIRAKTFFISKDGLIVPKLVSDMMVVSFLGLGRNPRGITLQRGAILAIS